ncbi:dTDP-4-dehydrorhamnose reductase [Alkalihalobacillus xiaoxiensis]|uniref:dTDP-4-dehydrorhamnose reductase n=1 Tax=Shouchella xiaoxiensis TaxID=766895 RepID=A0ABS2SV63_9BACI|nr:dTDP-4-dehydrorhamnose reductase [Shouchella xiaoxiensis]MBM7839406.1 dTDP-4-dehydrorhamnose reductase [Shouchella xiaoxiensis]
MKILVTGSNGQLGYDVLKEGKKSGLNIKGVGRKEFNIIDKSQVENYIFHMNPDIIIHCAAFTSVDEAEQHKKLCMDVNYLGTKNIAETAKKINAKLVYISTDYVFNGEGNLPFDETTSPCPINYYGETKLDGENVIKALMNDWFIVRVSWVFGINGKNFVKSILKNAKIKHELNVVDDQIGSPTYTIDLARFLLDLIDTDKYGIYHVTNSGYCSWADFAEEIVKLSSNNSKVNRISSDHYQTKANRPKNSRLSKKSIDRNGFTRLPEWEDALKRFLMELNKDKGDTKYGK